MPSVLVQIGSIRSPRRFRGAGGGGEGAGCHYNETCPNQQAKHNQNRPILPHVGPIFFDFGALKTSRSDNIWSLQRRFVPSLLIMRRLELAWDALGAQELIPNSRDGCHCLHFGASWAPKPGQVSLPKPLCIEIRRCAQYPTPLFIIRKPLRPANYMLDPFSSILVP